MAAKHLTKLVRAGIPDAMDAIWNRIAQLDNEDCEQMFDPNDPTGEGGCVCDRCNDLERLRAAADWLTSHLRTRNINPHQYEQQKASPQ